MNPKTFTIIEKKWARGGKGGQSLLRNKSGYKCCLGFLCQTAGAKRITGMFFPHSMPDGHLVVPELVEGRGRNLAYEIANINDDNTSTDEARKQLLAPLFAKIGWKPVYK